MVGATFQYILSLEDPATSRQFLKPIVGINLGKEFVSTLPPTVKTPGDIAKVMLLHSFEKYNPQGWSQIVGEHLRDCRNNLIYRVSSPTKTIQDKLDLS